MWGFEHRRAAHVRSWGEATVRAEAYGARSLAEVVAAPMELVRFGLILGSEQATLRTSDTVAMWVCVWVSVRVLFRTVMYWFLALQAATITGELMPTSWYRSKLGGTMLLLLIVSGEM